MKDFLYQIVKNLQDLKPYKIILFGSHAAGTYDDQSDIDLVVVLDTEEIPQTYDNKLELKVRVRECIYELSRQMPIDLVVYTRGEFKVLQNRKTSFYNDIIEHGKVLYEKAG